MEKQTTINQHYVPRFYMKIFLRSKMKKLIKKKHLYHFISLIK